MGIFDDLESKAKEWAGNVEQDLEQGGVNKLKTLGSKDGILSELEETEPGKYQADKQNDDSDDASSQADSDDDSDSDDGSADDSTDDSDTDSEDESDDDNN
jgi:hypothetical protein